MITINFDTEDTSLTEDIELLDLTQKYFSNNQKWCYTSSKLRHFSDDTRYPYPAAYIKTFDSGINFLNEMFNGKNPALMNEKPISAIYQIHTRVFYKRLYIYLFEKEQSLLNYGNVDYIPNTSPSPFLFDVKNLKVSPSFSPLFVGLICSLSKANNWRNLKDNTLKIAEGFYTEAYRESDKFYPSYEDNGKALYTYWLDILFPDELFDLISKYDRIIKQTYDSLQFDQRYYLYPLEEKFPNIIFKSRAGQRSFYHHMINKLDEYRKFSDKSQINLFDELTSAWETIALFEKDLSTASSHNNAHNNNNFER